MEEARRDVEQAEWLAQTSGRRASVLRHKYCVMENGEEECDRRRELEIRKRAEGMADKIRAMLEQKRLVASAAAVLAAAAPDPDPAPTPDPGPPPADNSDLYTSERIVYYQTQAIESLQRWHIFWTFVFYTVALGVCLHLFSTQSLPVALVCTLVIAAYPFYAYPLVNALWTVVVPAIKFVWPEYVYAYGLRAP